MDSCRRIGWSHCLSPHMLQKPREAIRTSSVWLSALLARCPGLSLPCFHPVQTAWSRVKVAADALDSNAFWALPDRLVPLGNITISSCSSCLRSYLLRFANRTLTLKLVLTEQPARILNPHLPSFQGTVLSFQSNIVLYQNCLRDRKTKRHEKCMAWKSCIPNFKCGGLGVKVNPQGCLTPWPTLFLLL